LSSQQQKDLDIAQECLPKPCLFFLAESSYDEEVNSLSWVKNCTVAVSKLAWFEFKILAVGLSIVDDVRTAEATKFLLQTPIALCSCWANSGEAGRKGPI
jgi:hypothetical protein